MSERRRGTGGAIYVEIDIDAPLDRIWELTQNTDLHPRWDVRFSRIEPIGELASGAIRFRYERSLLVHSIVGVGTSIGERLRDDGTRTSALRFSTDHRMSPLASGRGYWRYIPHDSGVRFITGYDYTPGMGRVGLVLDRLFTRRLVGWMTAWSFDRLRIWAESDVAPERWPLASALMFWRRGRPRASRCRRHPPGRARAMDDAPGTLSGLESP